MSNDTEGPVLSPRQRHWLAHLQRCQRSGTSLKAYADTKRLSVTALYTARRDLKARGVWPCEPQPAAPRFVSVKVAPAAVVEAMTVRLPNGVVVEMAPGGAPESCAALVRALMAPAP